MKKIMLWALAVILIFTVACSKTQVEVTEETVAEPEKVETIVERIDRLEIKDIVAEIDTTLEMTSQNLHMVVKSDSSLSYVAEPFRMHLTVDSIINDNASNTSSLEAFADGTSMIVNTNYTKDFVKYDYHNPTVDADSLVQMYTTANFKDYYETWKDKLVLTETETEYTITLEGEGDDFKALVLDEMRTLQGLRVDDKLISLYLIKGVKLVHTFVKATNQPTSLSLFMNYMFSAESANTEHVVNLESKFLEVNQGTEIVFPPQFDTLEVETTIP